MGKTHTETKANGGEIKEGGNKENRGNCGQQLIHDRKLKCNLNSVHFIDIFCANVDTLTNDKFVELNSVIQGKDPSILAMSEICHIGDIEICFEQYNIVGCN